MITKKENATWIPPVNDGTAKPKRGWLSITNSQGSKEVWSIIDIHSFDDFGATLDTFTIERGNGVNRKNRETKEIYSYDDGETFTFDAH